MKNAVRLHNISFCVDDRITGNHSTIYTRCVSIYEINKLIKMGKIKNPCIHMGFCLVRKKRLELSQDKLPLEPESSASAIPPSPLTTTIIAQSGRHCKCFLQKNKFFS